MKIALYKLTLFIIAILTYQHAISANISANFQVTATLQATCLLSVTNLNFGVFNSTNTSKTITGTWSATCSNGLAYTMGISSGVSGDPENRIMSSNDSNNNDKLIYTISDSIFFNPVIGEKNEGNVKTISGTGNGAKQDTIFYGLLKGPQFVTPGVYSESLSMTLTF